MQFPSKCQAMSCFLLLFISHTNVMGVAVAVVIVCGFSALSVPSAMVVAWLNQVALSQ